MKKEIGRTDKADFPEFHLTDIDIKVDTGAYTSSIHCHKIEEINIDGESAIKFTLMDPAHPLYNEKEFISKSFVKKRVKSSFGQREQRFAIKTIIHIFGKSYKIGLTLSERSDMKYPVLLGRKFLGGKFVVDTSKQNLSYSSKEK